MYITKIYLENIRCFEKLDLTFTGSEDGCKFILYLGPNGVGKTTILRSIALGLCDETSAAGLISEIDGDMVRHGRDVREGVIRIELREKSSQKSFTIETKIKPVSENNSSERVIRNSITDDFPWNKLFLCGYGASRSGFGTSAYKKYKAIDAVYTLFNYEASLQNIEIPFYRLSHGEGESIVVRVLQRIESILDLPDGSIRLDKTGISVRGPWGEFITMGAIGEGYAATLAWISDMIGWSMLYQDHSFVIDLPGIVLIDEIENHLHPSWQKKIISSLHSQFPSIQFIATTHAPMCVIGTTDLRDDECELVTLKPEGKIVEARAGNKPPRGSRADQVLTSFLFDLDTSRDNKTVENVERYASLLSMKRKDEGEKAELVWLRSVLEQTLGSPETRLEEFVEKAVHKALSELGGHEDKGVKLDSSVAGYEIRRQLASLFGRGKKT